MKISNTITDILNNIKTKVPDILSDKDLQNFDTYGIGYPTDQSKLFCAIRYSSGEYQSDTQTFCFTVHLQLLTDEETAYKYIDAVNEYLNDFDPADFGFMDGKHSIELAENFRTTDNQAFFDITLSKQLDDCD